MPDYQKPWLTLDDQLARLRERGVSLGDEAECRQVLQATGYYRLSGYLYPFRESEIHLDGQRAKVRVLANYKPGTTLQLAVDLIDFDRRLRMHVLDGTERIEVSLRMRIGYELGRESPFAHLEPRSFMPSFLEPKSPVVALDGTRESIEALLHRDEHRSAHALLIERLRARQNESNESFVAHFREKYNNRMPIWALTEIMEMGHLSRLFSGLNTAISSAIVDYYGVPSKAVLGSWIATLNYVRNVAAHHARLFNRKLQTAPKRPPLGTIPLLDHLKSSAMPKDFGTYNALAVMAYLLSTIDPAPDWSGGLVSLVDSFPSSPHIGESSMGFPPGWRSLDLWA